MSEFHYNIGLNMEWLFSLSRDTKSEHDHVFSHQDSIMLNYNDIPRIFKKLYENCKIRHGIQTTQF